MASNGFEVGPGQILKSECRVARRQQGGPVLNGALEDTELPVVDFGVAVTRHTHGEGIGTTRSESERQVTGVSGARAARGASAGAAGDGGRHSSWPASGVAYAPASPERRAELTMVICPLWAFDRRPPI